MIQLDPVLPTYPRDQVSIFTWDVLKRVLNSDGHAFYKHPNLSLIGKSLFPDFVILTKRFLPLVVYCLGLTIDDLLEVSPDRWVKADGEFAPLMEI